MSRIGKAPIEIPEGIKVSLSENNIVTAEAKSGKLEFKVMPDIKVNIEGNLITLERPTEQKKHKSAHGLSRSIIASMVEGLYKGYEKHLELIGVGFKATNKGQILELSLGYSHDIVFVIPDEVSVATETLKGKAPKITLKSHDKQLLGQVAAKIRSLRKPEPYKGKGVRYSDEYVRRKTGKNKQ